MTKIIFQRARVEWFLLLPLGKAPLPTPLALNYHNTTPELLLPTIAARGLLETLIFEPPVLTSP